VLPAYLLALGVFQVATVPLFCGLAIALVSLSAAGRLGPAVRALPELASRVDAPDELGGQPGSGDPTGSATADPFPPEATDALAGLVTPTSVLAIGLGVVGTFVVWVLARSVASAVTQGTVWGAVDGRAPLVDGVATAGRWRTFLGLSLLRFVLVIAAFLPAALASIAAVALLGTASTTGPGAGAGSSTGLLFAGLALVAIVLALGGVLIGLLALFLLVFAGPAVVVDDRGTLGAARASAGFVRSHPTTAIGFGLFLIGSYVVVAVLAGLFALVGVDQVVGLLVPLALTPFLDAFATALYAGASVAPADRSPVRIRVGRTFGRGLRELGAYPRTHPVATLAASACLAGSAVAGYVLTTPYGQIVTPPADVAGVFGSFPIDTFATLAVNNWLVSARLAFGGLALSLPAAVGLGLNGLLIGAVAGVSDPATFLALVAPHGVLELPAIALAGGVGIALGRTGWRALRGRADAATVADELERVGLLLVGLAVVLVVAAFIEAFLTPQVAAAVLG